MNSNNDGNRNQKQQPEHNNGACCVEFAETTHYSRDFQGHGEVAHRWKYQWRNHSEESFAADDADDDDAAPTIYRTPELVTIDQYYELEEKHCPKKAERANFKHIETALPRHFAIVAATRQPRQYITRTELCVMTLQNAPTQNKIQSRARARIHTTCDITPFTETTLHQRVIIITRTGIAHLLVKKLAGLFWTERHMHQSALTFADLVASFISSALACEYLIGNRYYRNLPVILAEEKQPVGWPTPTTTAAITEHDATPAKIQETTQELQALYDANIDRLEATIAQYARGFVSLEAIRTDPDFVQMLSKFWRLNFQTMKARSCAESRIATLRSISSGLFDEEKCSADRVIACRNLFSAQCQFSRLMQYNVAHLFDNSNFNYVSLLYSAKSSQLRLCNDGLTAALLTFAAIEPRMVTAEMTPYLGDVYMRCELSGAANHIQTRDPVFGEMLAKHRQHVPRMNELTELSGIRRPVFFTIRPPSYVPLQSALDSIRSGQVRSYRRLEKPDRCAPSVAMTRSG
jgi:hypothetical protein